MTETPIHAGGPTQAPTAFRDYEYELARLRIEHSAQYVGRMIWVITVIAGGISVIVVVSVVLISIVGILQDRPANIPDVLSNWGGIILGFYFGQFVNLVKDFMGIVSGASLPQTERRAVASPPA